MDKTCIIMPLFNDWQSAAMLLSRIDPVVARWDSRVTLVMVDDGSQEPMPEPGKLIDGCPHIKEVQVIHLVCNQGHQRAIAAGLAYARARQCFSSVFVMDSDGEDPPHELDELRTAGRRHPQAIITADRASRSEGLLFRTGYRCYRLLFRLLTGTAIRFGNFCHIPAAQLERLVHYPDLWNSFSGCIRKSGLPVVGTPSHRASRYIGPSKMNLMSLVLHGLSAISVFLDAVLVRLIIAAALAGAFFAVWVGLGIWMMITGPVGGNSPVLWLPVLLLLLTWPTLLVLLTLTLKRLHHRAHALRGPADYWQAYVKTITPLRLPGDTGKH